jgi:hypothetical protein
MVAMSVRIASPAVARTGLTRAARHCTLLIEEDISPLLSMRRLEQSDLLRINASLFSFQPVPDDLRVLGGWYEEGKIHSTLAEYMVRSKSEVIITNLPFDREIPFTYETSLFAPDGTFYLPDFTITWHGQEWYGGDVRVRAERRLQALPRRSRRRRESGRGPPWLRGTARNAAYSTRPFSSTSIRSTLPGFRSPLLSAH